MNQKQYLAIDIGGTSVKLGVVDETGAVLAKAEESVSFDGYETPILTTVLKAAKTFVDAQGAAVTLTATVDGKEAQFEAKGRTLLSPGWEVLQQADIAEDDAEAEPANPVPAMKPGTQATALSGTVLTRKWRPPVPLLTFTAWQLTAGGLLLLPVARCMACMIRIRRRHWIRLKRMHRPRQRRQSRSM